MGSGPKTKAEYAKEIERLKEKRDKEKYWIKEHKKTIDYYKDSNAGNADWMINNAKGKIQQCKKDIEKLEKEIKDLRNKMAAL